MTIMQDMLKFHSQKSVLKKIQVLEFKKNPVTLLTVEAESHR
jgi:hypothetical protein